MKKNDQDISLEPVLLENECWTNIKIDPVKLPQGEHLVSPGALYIHLSHKPITPVKASLNSLFTELSFIYHLISFAR